MFILKYLAGVTLAFGVVIGADYFTQASHTGTALEAYSALD